MQPNDTGGIRHILVKYLRHYPYFILSLALAATLVFLYLKYSTSLYQIKATLLIKNDNGPGGQTNDLFKDLFLPGNSKNVENEIEILRSASLTKRVVEKKGLQKMIFLKGKIRNANLYHSAPFNLDILKVKDSSNSVSLIINIIDSRSYTIAGSKEQYRFGDVVEHPMMTFKLSPNEPFLSRKGAVSCIITWRPIDDAADRFLSTMEVKKVNKFADIIQLDILADNDQEGLDFLNELMNQYNELAVEDKNKTTEQTDEFITQRLDIIKKELEDVESKLKEYQQRNNVLDIDGQTQMYMNVVQENDKQLLDVTIREDVVKALSDYINDSKNYGRLVPNNLGLEDVALNMYIKQYNDAILLRDRELLSTTKENPVVIGLEKQIVSLRTNIQESIRKLKQSIDITRNNIVSQNSRFGSQIASLPAKQRELLEIKRQQGIKQELYIFLLKKREENALQKAATISNSRVVDQASTSKQPSKPNKRILYTFAIILGLFLPIIFIYLKELLNDKVRGKADVKSRTSTPILGSIGHSEDKKAPLVVTKTRKVIAEQFRVIRTNLKYFLSKVEKPVIMVTSSFSGEGKSFISTNLAAAFALSGKKVILLEFDLRKPRIASTFGLPKQKGLSNLLYGNADVKDIIYEMPDVPNLYFIPCGAVPPNPAELLLNGTLKQLFDDLKQDFDMIVVDTAPAGLVSDAFVLGEYSNTTIYIVRHGYTFKKQMPQVEEYYQGKRLPGMAIIINDIDAESMEMYGYDSYQYGKGYYDDEERRPWYKRLFMIG